MSDHKDHKPRSGELRQSPNSKKNAARKIIIGTLAASATVPLSDWEVLAHGNRSSHKAAAFRTWAPDAYMLMRQELTAPNADATQRLRKMYDALEDLERTPPSNEAEREQQRIQMREDIRALENSQRAAPLSRQVLDFAQTKDKNAVSATLAESGPPDTVIDNYTWVLLDLGHAADRGVLSSNSNSQEFEVVSEAALEFATKRLSELQGQEGDPFLVTEKIKLANLLHNITSFNLPDIGRPTGNGLAIGRRAILLQLALREELNQSVERVRALNLAGRLFVLSGEIATAELYLDQAEALALKIGYRPGLAYNKAYRAELKDADDAASARLLRDEARVIAQSVQDSVFDDIPYLLAFLDRPR